MPVLRAVSFAAVVVLAVVLQVTFFGFFSVGGVVPDLVLLVVVAAGLTRGPEVAATLGFAGGLALDLAPPADTVAGRWALALVLAGYLAGRVRQDATRSSLLALATVAACALASSTVYALSGMLLQDPALPASQALRVIPLAVGYDLLLAPFVLPPVMRMFRRLRPLQIAY